MNIKIIKYIAKNAESIENTRLMPVNNGLKTLKKT